MSIEDADQRLSTQRGDRRRFAETREETPSWGAQDRDLTPTTPPRENLAAIEKEERRKLKARETAKRWRANNLEKSRNDQRERYHAKKGTRKEDSSMAPSVGPRAAENFVREVRPDEERISPPLRVGRTIRFSPKELPATVSAETRHPIKSSLRGAPPLTDMLNPDDRRLIRKFAWHLRNSYGANFGEVVQSEFNEALKEYFDSITTK